ncbi:MAG TPA: BT4734/BF3469 family protein [Candidatus Acidoferrum sp.]|nr:BT4734/BF3469 family protein [Candidatus Acidoferrum sp.]
MIEVLSGVSNGQWADRVERVRALPYHSREQLREKERLPFWTPSGRFRYRRLDGFVQHSGHVAIDLDDLGVDGEGRAMHKAVDDPHCRCAFRSSTGHGLRLIFGCPPCDANRHKVVFASVADYVRQRYGVAVDMHTSDVTRACFVSYDRGLWLNIKAPLLPELLGQDQTTHKDFKIPVCCLGLSEGDINTLAYGLGESRAPFETKPDGTCYTHLPLRDLARDLVVRFRRHHLVLDRAQIERAFEAWHGTGKRKGIKYRGSKDEYFSELLKSIRCAKRLPWLDAVVNFWPKWTREPGFPSDGTSDDKVEWCIRRYCETAGTNRFFLSARDAATLTGTNFSSANQTLHRIVHQGIMYRVGKRLLARHAQEYELRMRSPKPKSQTPQQQPRKRTERKRKQHG